ncbi:hypothetical protein SRHO_G00136980 [Serrasalmus rhombeus]
MQGDCLCTLPGPWLEDGMGPAQTGLMLGHDWPHGLACTAILDELLSSPLVSSGLIHPPPCPAAAIIRRSSGLSPVSSTLAGVTKASSGDRWPQPCVSRPWATLPLSSGKVQPHVVPLSSEKLICSYCSDSSNLLALRTKGDLELEEDRMR